MPLLLPSQDKAETLQNKGVVRQSCCALVTERKEGDKEKEEIETETELETDSIGVIPFF